MISRREFLKSTAISVFGSLLLGTEQVTERFFGIDQKQQQLSNKIKKLNLDDSLFSEMVYYVSTNDVWSGRERNVNFSKRAFLEFTEVCMSYGKLWFDPNYHYIATYFVEKVYPERDRIDKDVAIEQWKQKAIKRMSKITPDECCSIQKYTVDQGKTWYIPGRDRQFYLSSVDR